MANKINHLIDAYRQLGSKNESFVLATIIETAGSTYQKAGARMLITKNGELLGLLGGGCFEADLIEQARTVFDTGTVKTVFYDMRSPADLVWGLGLGCNGAVRVFLQLVQAGTDYSPLNIISGAAEAGVSGVLLTVYESAHPDFPSGRSYFLPQPTADFPDMSAAIPAPFSASALQTRWQKVPRIETLSLDGQEISVFFDVLQPPLHLLILGAGADAIPLAGCAKSLGWRFSIVDHRPDNLKPGRFPKADTLLNLMPEAIHAHLDLSRFSAVVLMTHNFDYDARYLKAIAGGFIPFIGLLGPAQRKDRLLQSLGSEGEVIKKRVFGPVGLDIGAQTPEEIALSIMAGIYAGLNRRSGQQLAHKPPVEANECSYS